MVGSCEQIVSMLSASNEWPQIKEDDEQRSLNSNKKMMITKEEVKAMEKTAASQEPLKCPRCESSNTKFCYYNNYSLSQPRHFCKACKRYWTRGGTLRNVPVGGGCRKNKRFRRNPNFSNPNSSSNNSSSNISDQSNFNSQSLNTNPNGISPLLYGLPTNLVPHEAIINGFPSFSSGYENSNHHLGGVGLGFSSNGMILDHGGARNKQILQELISSSNPNSMSMSSNLLTSRFQQHQQKYNFETLLPYGLDLQTKEIGCHGDSVKLEETDHSRRQSQIQNRFDQMHQQEPIGDSDSSILWNENHTNWLDPNFSNLGSSSVPSLI